MTGRNRGELWAREVTTLSTQLQVVSDRLSEFEAVSASAVCRWLPPTPPHVTVEQQRQHTGGQWKAAETRSARATAAAK